MEKREPSDRYAAIAADLVSHDPRLLPLKESCAPIAYLASDKEQRSRGRTVYAECERVPAKYRWALPYEFTITVYEPNAERLDEEQLRILMLHELMHVGCELDGHEWRYRIVPHDVEDFRAIIDQYGIDWSTT